MEHGATVQRLAEHSRSVRRTALIRATVGVSMLASWGLMTATGLVLAVGPWEDIEDLELRSRTIFLGMDQASWGGVHMGIAYVAVTATIVHISMVWRALGGYLRHLTSQPAAQNLRGGRRLPARPAGAVAATTRTPPGPAQVQSGGPPAAVAAASAHPPVVPDSEVADPVAGSAEPEATSPQLGDLPTVVPVSRDATGIIRRDGSPPVASLRVTMPDGAQRQVAVTVPWMSVGRGPDNLLVIDDPRVSQSHLGIRWEAPQYVIYDLSSRNETRVNGQLIRRVGLRSGDEIQVGESRISFQAQDPAANWQVSQSSST